MLPTPDSIRDKGRALAIASPLSHLVGRVNHRISRQIERTLGADGLTIEQWRVLDLLSDGEGHPMTEIAGHAMVPAPTLTKIIDRLSEAALVYRRPAETDRRRVLVFLSDHGRARHAGLAPLVTEVEAELLVDLDELDLALLTRLLRRLAD
jgi:DNA-binding MarR family transcriptional regulator